MNTGFRSGTRSRVVGRVHPPPLPPSYRSPDALCSAVPRALTADGILEVGALGGVVGELDPAEPPESLRPAGRVVTLLRGQGCSGPRNAAAHLPHPSLRGQPRTFRKKSLRVYARSSQEISSSDSLVPHLPFISAPRDSGMSACSVISCQWGAGLRRVTPTAAPQPRRPPEPLPRPHSHPRSCWPTRRKGR